MDAVKNIKDFTGKIQLLFLPLLFIGRLLNQMITLGEISDVYIAFGLRRPSDYVFELGPLRWEDGLVGLGNAAP